MEEKKIRNNTLEEAKKEVTANFDYNAGPSVCHDKLIEAIEALKE